MIGTTLSHYRIVEELGRGGMGIVYKAEDTKLDRTVALKILPASALSSDDDRARFYREAKAAAQLNHPHIASVHEIDEAVPEGAPSDDLRPFIAMEFIDGKSLEDTAKEGPMALEEVVRLATQIAQALEAAHEKNIVHRDIKSANVMLTAKGQAKVLDFGLAKTAHSTMLTRMGSTLGTVAYMSPEQARGEDVDLRTDLWALGILMYELIAGRLPFGGDYEQAVTYSILNEDPHPLTAIRTGVPMGLEWIVSKLLAKKADDRYQSATDLMVDLRTVDLTQAGMSRAASVKSMPAVEPARKKSNPLDLTDRLHPALILLFVSLAIAIGWWVGRSSAPAQEPGTTKRINQLVPLGGVIATMDISPDGSLVAFGTDTVEIMDLTTGALRAYDAPEVFVHMAFSEDGEYLLMTTSTGIKILSVGSGSVIDVTRTVEGGPRAEWIDNETILYEERSSVWTRSLTSGASRQVVTLDSLAGEYDADFPSMLPDGKTVMATGQTRGAPDWIGFWDFDSGERIGRIDLGAARLQWVESGHLVAILDGNLVAIPFDLETLKQAGPIIPLEDNVRPEGMAVSREGTLIHVGAQVGIVANARPIRPMVMQMLGASVELAVEADLFPSGIYRSAAISPDGSRAAVVIEQEGIHESTRRPPADIWILDFQNGTRRAVTTGGINDYPTWNPTGDSLYYVQDNRGNSSIMIKAASGRGAAETVLETSIPALIDLDLSPDGRMMAFAGAIPTSIDMTSTFVLYDLGERGERPAVLGGASDLIRNSPNGNPRHFAFSPDGNYVAYEDQGGIFVQSVDDPDSPPFQVWENGMTLPKWAPDGSILYTRSSLSGGFGVPVQQAPFFSTLGDPIDYTAYWYVISGELFDTFPTKDRILAGMPATDAAVEADETAEEQSIDMRMIINLTSELRKDR